MWDEIIHQFPNFTGAAAEVWNGLVIYLPLYWAYDYLSTLELKLMHGSKRTPANLPLICSVSLCFNVMSYFQMGLCDYTPRFNEVERGVYWYHLVRLSVCGQNRVRSVSSTTLIASISYLHILSSNLRRCVVCNARFKIQKFEILAIFLNL